MSERIPQSVAYLVVFRAYLASDGKTPATGKTIAITLSKNGATSFSNPAAGATNATEMASGFYKFTLATGDTDTVGPLAWRGAHADINDAGDVLSVAKATNAGFSALPDAAAEAAGGLYTRGTGAGQLSQSANGELGIATLAKTLTTYTGDTPQTGDAYARLGAPAGVSHAADIAAVQGDTDNIQTRLPAALTSDGNIKADTLRVGGTLQTAGDLAALLTTIATYIDTEVAAIKAKTDNLPSDPADASDIAASFSSVASTLATIAGYLDTEIAAIKAKTDNLPSDPADESLIIAATDAIAAAIAALSVPTAAANAAALLDLADAIETGVTLRQAQRLQLAALAGKLSGAAGTTVTFRNVGDSKDRIVAVVDSNGNRTAVTVDAT